MILLVPFILTIRCLKMIKKVGVLGAGTMGSAIAEVMAYNGIEVVLKDVE
ncbi:MAG: 3-hydroxyacyl-CoA dehydrogenase NAD-binding domain-containing protein, partial [Thermoplasmata archaeon]